MTAVPVRTHLVHDEHGAGSWTRALRRPDPRLRDILYRDLLGFEQRRAAFASWLEPPRLALTVMIDLEGQLVVDGAPLPGDWIAGLSDEPAIVRFGPRYASIDLELTPLGAYRVLGRPLAELQGQSVALEDVFGRRGRDVAGRVRELADWDARFDVIEAFLLERAAHGPSPTPAVAWALGRLGASDGRVRIAALARELGCSRRYLHAAFRDQVGLGPKMVARVLRFAAVRREITRAPAGWADIAARCGYSDQSHLTREFRDLAGTTPTDFVRRLLPGYGGVVGDDLPNVQD